MNKRIAAHTPLLKFILVIIGTWILVMTGFYSYSEYQRVRHLLNFYRHQSEARGYGSLKETIDYFAGNPMEMDGTWTEDIDIVMKKVSDAGAPQDVWHVIGWHTGANSIQRMEKCFAVPAATD